MNEIAMAGEIVEDDDFFEEDNASFVVKTDISRMTWGDQMVHARFQLLLETIGDVDQNEEQEAANAATEEEEKAIRAANRERAEARRAALRELLAGFDELTEFLDRVARVRKNGVRIPMAKVPMPFITDVMNAIASQRGRRASKN